jgi:hypothetical protein
MHQILFITILFLAASCQIVCEETQVLEVGGCDSNGECGVFLSNGKYDRLKYPVKGQKVKVCE